MAHSIKRCFLCGHEGIVTVTVLRHVSVRCFGCGAGFIVEFDPPDDPRLRGRIALVQSPVEEADSTDDELARARS